MLGLNPAMLKIAGGVGVVIMLMSGVIWWQHKAIGKLNQDLGGYEQQNKQLASNLMYQINENNQLREYQEREAEIRRARDEQQQRAIRRLQAEARAWADSVQEDPAVRVWRDTGVPVAVSERLCQLFPGTDENGDPVCGAITGHGAGHAAPPVAGP